MPSPLSPFCTSTKGVCILPTFLREFLKGQIVDPSLYRQGLGANMLRQGSTYRKNIFSAWKKKI